MPQSLIAPATTQPQSLSDLFWSFTILALQGFGGVLAIVQRELVEKKRWMTLEEFAEDWAVIVLTLAILFAGVADEASARGALRGLAAVAAGLIAATGLKLLPALKKNAVGRLGCALVGAASFLAVAYLRLPLALVLSGLGLPAAVWAWYRLGRV